MAILQFQPTSERADAKLYAFRTLYALCRRICEATERLKKIRGLDQDEEHNLCIMKLWLSEFKEQRQSMALGAMTGRLEYPRFDLGAMRARTEVLEEMESYLEIMLPGITKITPKLHLFEHKAGWKVGDADLMVETIRGGKTASGA